MPSFALHDTTAPIVADLEIDEDRDLVLNLNGVRVLYISSRTGSAYRFYVAPEDRAKLGCIALDADHIQIA